MQTFKTKYEQFNAFVIRHIGGFTVVIFVLLLGGVINGTVSRCSMSEDLETSNKNQIEIIERNSRVDSVNLKWQEALYKLNKSGK